jgi:putative ABC transport system permease protein
VLEGAGTDPKSAQAWISEAAADLYHWTPGMTIELPLGSSREPFTVAGIWRDYTRQNGTVVIDRGRYVAATGDDRVNDVWVWLKPGRSIADLRTEIDARLGASGLVDIRDAASIRRISLSIFDRTFAVTYLLEGVAVLIGLFGISVGFGSQVLARRGEFGVLRHIGVTRGQIAALLGIEGLAAGIVGIIYGLATGGAISVLLVHVINRQSFHWSMDMHVPGLALLGVSAVLVGAATVTAIISGRQAMTGQPIAAVKEDW